MDISSIPSGKIPHWGSQISISCNEEEERAKKEDRDKVPKFLPKLSIISSLKKETQNWKPESAIFWILAGKGRQPARQNQESKG